MFSPARMSSAGLRKRKQATITTTMFDERTDWPAVDRLMELQGLRAKSFPPEAFKSFRDRFAAGHGAYPLIGTPYQIADELEKISAAGVCGHHNTFVNYVSELPLFCEEVLPRLEAKGLRRKQKCA